MVTILEIVPLTHLLLVLLVRPSLAGNGPFFRHDADPDLVQYLQPNDVSDGKYDNLTTSEAEKMGLCARQCDGAKPMVCYFHLTLENYATIGPACGLCLNGTEADCFKKGCVTADGVERPILTINRRLTGPSIQVCRGDTIVVDVKNKMIDRIVTMHWHGVYQRHSPHSDGVPLLTQCPIIPETIFRYIFPAMPYGTFFYHSHTGLQKMDGLLGSLVIRRPKSADPNKAEYDFDLPSHVIIITDWLHGMTDAKFPGNTYANFGTRTESFLINGRSVFTPANGTAPKVPYSVFKVKKGFRYRFRLIGGSCLACPMLFFVEKHRMNLITVDGTPVEPQIFDSITIFPGDRMDVVINTNQTGGQFWIQVKTLCEPKVSAEAILEYEDGDKGIKRSNKPGFDTFPRGRSLNGLDASDCSEDNPNVCWNHVNSLSSATEKATVLKPLPDLKLVFAVDEYHFTLDSLFWNDEDEYHRWFQSGPNVIKTHLVNNITMAMPPFPLLSQDLPIPKDLECPKDRSVCGGSAKDGGKLCACADIVKVGLDQVAEIIFIDWIGPTSTFLHPMHLHGTDIFIIEQGLIPKGVDHRAFVGTLQERLAKEAADLATKIRPKPCVKDTVTIPPNGYTVVRVHFNNPGMWIMHCHFLFHTETGMNTVFQVGERKDFVKTPPNFPTCNNYLPTVDPNQFKNIDWDDEPTIQAMPNGTTSAASSPGPAASSPGTTKKP
uniref:Laccase-3 n=1 Tax=Cacopsylla melanoneura TaxID=428564 RepID=A0A8D9B1A8_9HEMI